MEIISNYFSKQDITGLFSTIGVSIKVTFIVLFAVIAIGWVASALEKVITAILGAVLGSAFALVFSNYLTFPGTILHELSHALVATITGAKVTEISFFDFGVSLGHVSYILRGPHFIRALQDSLTACAPVVSGVFASLLLFDSLTQHSHSIGITILLIYLMVSVIDHMTMSIVDGINYFKGIWAPALVIFVSSFIICLSYI